MLGFSVKIERARLSVASCRRASSASLIFVCNRECMNEGMAKRVLKVPDDFLLTCDRTDTHA